MAQPSHAHVALILAQCQKAGVVKSWFRKPLGLYTVHEWDGDTYSFTRKDATLWGQGVLSGLSYGQAANAGRVRQPRPLKRPSAPGWYRDPARVYAARWFDGIRWTDHVK